MALDFRGVGEGGKFMLAVLPFLLFGIRFIINERSETVSCLGTKYRFSSQSKVYDL